MRPVKILIAGDWHSELHEEVMSVALRNLGCEVVSFKWCEYFYVNGGGLVSKVIRKLQNKYLFGPLVTKLNQDLINLAKEESPTAIFIYRGSHIFPETVSLLRDVCPGAVLIGYNNDDPFSPHYPRWMWRHFLGSLPAYDIVLAYRDRNLSELQRAGARRVHLMRSWFVPDRNFPVSLNNTDRLKYGCDVVFVGHYEDDGRLSYLEEVVRRGYKLRIFGHGYSWNPALRKSALLADHAPTRTIWGSDYNRAICGAKVALCFLSKLNRDTYTRRCFEIPASGTVLLSEHSSDLAQMFVPDREAVFFKSTTEMVEKLEWLLEDSTSREGIAVAGRERVWRGRHDVNSRMEDLLELVKNFRD